MIELCEATEDNPFIHGMSKQFVKALQQLFDVMDTDHTGTIKYTDLAKQWEEDQSDPFFPKGLITCLAKVVLPNGLLTFDRFCAGIKLCLLKNQVELKEGKDVDVHVPIGMINENSTRSDGPTMFIERPSSQPQVIAPPPPPPSLPPTLSSSSMSEINNNSSFCNKNNMSSSFHSSSTFNCNNSSTNNTISNDDQSKAKKLPLPSYEQVMAAKSKSTSKLALDCMANSSQSSFGEDGGNGSNCVVHMTQFATINGHHNRTNSIHGNEQGQIVRPILNVYENFSTLSNDNARYRAKSMSHLENISSNQLVMPYETSDNAIKTTTNGDYDSSKQSTNVSTTSLTVKNLNATTSGLQPKTLSRNCILKTLQNWRDNILHHKVPAVDSNEITVSKNIEISSPISDEGNGIMLRRNVQKRREPRRHTVGANGIDLYAIKRFQQLEQEKDILIRGLNEIDKTKEWYIRQIACIQDKINFAGRSGSFPSDCNIDAYQERINFQSARIHNLNQHLIALREANQNFPLHMNLAIRPFNGVQRIDPNQPKQLVLNPNLVNKLKDQNRLLTDEVSRKSDRITQLEREKSSLIRELFQARTYSSYYNGDFDDTFM